MSNRAEHAVRYRPLWPLLGLFLACVAVCAQTPDTGPASDDTPTTVFRHPEKTRWYVAGQINVIFQAHPPFHSPYMGPNSLKPWGQSATSHVATLYTGVQLTRTTDFLFDVESASGRGLSDALGLAGFVNLDVVRNPSLGGAPYLARVMLRQIIPLSHEKVESERTPFSLSTQLPARRLELRFGKFGMADFFDVNSVGSDSHTQFLNWTIDNNGAYDYAADTRGYTWGLIADFEDRHWGVRFAEAAMPTVANGIKFQTDLSLAHSENVEFELRGHLRPERATVVRLLGFVNHANMGVYSEAIHNAVPPAPPDITAHPLQVKMKYGAGLNAEQQITARLRAYGRLGWNDGHTESYVYTEVDRHGEGGLQVAGDLWGRKLDKVGFAFLLNGLSRHHREYLALGGQGFLLGDGKLTYGRESILESYYTLHLWRGVYTSFDLQYVANPGYNRDRGPVIVPGLRLHIDL
jgi:carbohydrate-selective porin OprB